MNVTVINCFAAQNVHFPNKVLYDRNHGAKMGNFFRQFLSVLQKYESVGIV